MRKLPNIHAGEVLLEEFLSPMGISQNALARSIGVPPRLQATFDLEEARNRLGTKLKQLQRAAA